MIPFHADAYSKYLNNLKKLNARIEVNITSLESALKFYQAFPADNISFLASRNDNEKAFKHLKNALTQLLENKEISFLTHDANTIIQDLGLQWKKLRSAVYVCALKLVKKQKPSHQEAVEMFDNLKQHHYHSLDREQALFWLNLAIEAPDAPFEFVKQEAEQINIGMGFYLSLSFDSPKVRGYFATLCDTIIKKYTELRASEVLSESDLEFVKKSFLEVKNNSEDLKKWQILRRKQSTLSTSNASNDLILKIKKTLEQWPANKDKILAQRDRNNTRNKDEALEVQNQENFLPLFTNRLQFPNVLDNIKNIYNAKHSALTQSSLFKNPHEITNILKNDQADTDKVMAIRNICRTKLDKIQKSDIAKDGREETLLTQLLKETEYAFDTSTPVGNFNRATRTDMNPDLPLPAQIVPITDTRGNFYGLRRIEPEENTDLTELKDIPTGFKK